MEIWNLATLGEKLLLGPQADRLSSIIISPNAQTVAVIGWDKTIRMHDPVTHRRRCGTRLPWKFYFAGLVPDGKTMAIGTDSMLRLLDSETCSEGTSFMIPVGALFSTPFSNDGYFVATADWQNIVKIWNLRSGSEKTILPKNPTGVSSVAFAPDNKTLVTGDFQGMVRLWDLETGQSKGILQNGNRTLTAVTFSSDGKILASGSCDEMVRIWDLATGQQSLVLKDKFGCVTALVFSPDGRTLASSGWFGSQLWNVKNGQKLTNLTSSNSREGESLAFSPDSKNVFLGTGSTLRKFSVPDTTTTAFFFPQPPAPSVGAEL